MGTNSSTYYTYGLYTAMNTTSVVWVDNAWVSLGFYVQSFSNVSYYVNGTYAGIIPASSIGLGSRLWLGSQNGAFSAGSALFDDIICVRGNYSAFIQAGDFTNPPVFRQPTPAGGVVNNTQVSINVSCDSGRVWLWFDNASSPQTQVLTNVSSETVYNTSVSSATMYYYRAACFNDTTGFSGNSSVRNWTFDNVNPVAVLNANNGFTSSGFSRVNQYGGVLPLNVSLNDNNRLFFSEFDAYDPSNNLVFSLNVSLNTSSFDFTSLINVSS